MLNYAVKVLQFVMKDYFLNQIQSKLNIPELYLGRGGKP